MTQQELAERLYVTKGNVSGLIDRLVEAQLVERRPIPGDRRSHALFLTTSGTTLALAALEIQRRYVERTLGRLGDPDLAVKERLIRAWRDLARSDASG